ncbi:hypothetical protein [Macrococcoides caseolyticum]|uniref:Uncharacterized protein n=1 Tax=Macrococcoides caseolyticum TaxID=69966 RepID=A0ACC9MSP9_9STAP|nr:hypothetical protein [Macrococcus caseolyticus]PKE40455.1 hypothetical protein CW675_01720 [Macrococcus caseolyticus]PKE56709.1 hypothetical protein CW682_05775 [Macrococcus caseolyticus]
MFKKIIELQKRKNAEIKDLFSENPTTEKGKNLKEKLDKIDEKKIEKSQLSIQYFNNADINPIYAKKNAAKVYKNLAPNKKALVVADVTEKIRIRNSKSNKFKNGEKGLLIMNDECIYFIKHGYGVSYQEYPLNKVKGVQLDGPITIEIMFGRTPKYFSMIGGQYEFINEFKNIYYS